MSKQQALSFPVVNLNAAGIDVGSRSHWVCVGQGAECIKEFGVFTPDTHAMIAYLEQHGVKTVAMESTGFYWKPLLLMLQAAGFEVYLVNAEHLRGVRGKKSDVLDCQWIWQMHSVGLLKNSFQPDGFTEELRTYVRHRRSLVQGATRQVAKMQKALTVMNVHLPVVLSDITGESGQRIIEAILSGERDGEKLASLAHHRVKADRLTIAKALNGKWQTQYLFELQQCWQLYHFYQKQIAECDQRTEQLLAEKVKQNHQADLAYEPIKKKRRRQGELNFDSAKYAYQLSDGVDLLQVDGISYSTILTLLAETGVDLSGFDTSAQFVSWMCLCPNKKITGGKVKSSHTRKNKCALAYAFRQAANTVGNQKGTALSDFFHRIAYRKGRKVAITATARKLAITLYNMLQKRQPYQPAPMGVYQENLRAQKVKNIQRTISRLDIKPEELAFN